MNIQNLSNQINHKLSSTPYYGTSNDTSKTLTDMDNFPYTRFYRGVYNSTMPIVIEREAGWRPIYKNCYIPNKCENPIEYPNHCFESACSVVYPCYPQYLAKIADRDALNVQLNKSCIVQYR